MVPTRKIGAAGIAGALSVILVWLLGRLGVEVPAEVGTAVTALLAFAVGYVVPEGDDSDG